MVQRKLEIHLAPKSKKDIVVHKEQSSNISIRILLNLRSLRCTCETISVKCRPPQKREIKNIFLISKSNDKK